MWVLGIETSSATPSMAVASESTLLLECMATTGDPRAHDLWKDFLAQMTHIGFSLKDVDVVCVSTGPGRFTGIRAGVALGVGLRLSLGCRLCGVSSIEGLARAIASPQPAMWVYMPRPGRDEYYVQMFEFAGGDVARKGPMTCLSREDFLVLFREGKTVAGPGDELLEGELKTLGIAMRQWVSVTPKASILAQCVAREQAGSEEIFPLEYAHSPILRPS